MFAKYVPTRPRCYSTQIRCLQRLCFARLRKIENSIKENDILFELFTVPVESNEKSTVSVSDGNSKIKVIVDEEEFEFEMSNNQTILEATLKKDIDAPYSCQGGICSSCIARVTEGQTEMRQNNILTDNEVAEGLVLTCQAHPTLTEAVKEAALAVDKRPIHM